NLVQQIAQRLLISQRQPNGELEPVGTVFLPQRRQPFHGGGNMSMQFLRSGRLRHRRKRRQNKQDNCPNIDHGTPKFSMQMNEKHVFRLFKLTRVLWESPWRFYS